MNPLRSVMAVLGGMLLLAVLWRVMAITLVNALADEPLTDMTAYLNSHPGLLATTVGVQGIAALLAGYMTAKIAGQDELAHGAFAAALQTALNVWGFAMAPEAAQTPLWTRVAVVAVIGPAMVAGAAVRARAAHFKSEEAAAVPPGERS